MSVLFSNKQPEKMPLRIVLVTAFVTLNVLVGGLAGYFLAQIIGDNRATTFLIIVTLLIVFVVGVITTRRIIEPILHSEKTIRARKEQFETVIICAPIPMVVTDANQDIALFNDKFIEQFGYTLEDVSTAEAWWLAAYPDEAYRQEVRDSWAKAIADATESGGEIEMQEWDLTIKDRSVRRVEFKMTPVGEISVIAMNDITERKRAETALRESEERFRAITSNTPDHILMQDRQLRYTFVVNPQLGLTEQDMLGQTDYDFLSREEADQLTQTKTQVLESGRPVHFETSLIPKEGEPVFFDGSYIPKFDSTGKVDGLIGYFRNITERKLAEEIVRETDAQFRKLSANVPGLIFQFTRRPDGTYHVPIASEGIKHIFGCSPEDVLDDFAPISKVLFAEDSARVISDIEYSARHLTFFTCEFRVQIPGKAIQWIYSRSTPEKLADGSITWYGFNTDITDLKQAEQALSAEKERLAVTLRSIGDGVITTDIQGSVVVMNKVAEELTGWTQNEAEGKPLTAVLCLIDELTRQPREDITAKALSSSGIIKLSDHTILVSRDGAERTIADSAAPIRNRNSETIGMVLVFRDITEKLRTEQELLKIKKLESIGVLAGGIAHDFNNLLTSLFGNIELAKMFLAAEHKSYRFLETAERSMENATKLTQQLLTFAKGGDPVKETLSIGEVITETAQFSMRGSNARLQCNISPDLWPVEADKGQLGQVISNLVINAQQAMPVGGVITIAAENIENAGGRYVKFTVQDEGVGIAPQYLDKIFDPYFSTKQKGNGLGLASTHSIISKHNGTITVDSRLNQGAIFTIHLPAAEEKEKTAAGKPSEETPVTAVSSARILVLDDEEMIRNVIGAMLEKLGHEVTFAVDGLEAIAAYRMAYENGLAYDIVVTDLTIPGGMGGQAVAQEILKINPQTKLIVSSGYATDPVMANYKEYGYKGIAVKPYRFVDLQKVIQQVLKM